MNENFKAAITTTQKYGFGINIVLMLSYQHNTLRLLSKTLLYSFIKVLSMQMQAFVFPSVDLQHFSYTFVLLEILIKRTVKGPGE